MSKQSTTSWRDNFSKLLPNWRVSNSARPFAGGEYQQTDQINRQENRAVMRRVFKRIEDSCRPRSGDL